VDKDNTITIEWICVYQSQPWEDFEFSRFLAFGVFQRIFWAMNKQLIKLHKRVFHIVVSYLFVWILNNFVHHTIRYVWTEFKIFCVHIQ
jgi:hypothetical protein